jgi:hypothetical protein
VSQEREDGSHTRQQLNVYRPGSIIGAATAFHVGVRSANVSAGPVRLGGLGLGLGLGLG